MLPRTVVRHALGALMLPIAALLVSCAAEVVDAPAPASPHEVDSIGGDAATPEARELGSVSTGGTEARLAYLEGSTLVRIPAPDAERQDPFAFAFDGDAHGLALPDFSALARRGYDFTLATGDYLRAPTYATSSRGDVYYFEGFTQGARYGYAVAHAAPGRDAEVFEIPTGAAYAFFPSHLVVRGEGDVYVGAATVKNGTFGPDFPGCPISILHGQNGVFLAHLGPSGLTPIAFPGEGRLDTFTVDADGTLHVTTGWPADVGALDGEPNVREIWERTPQGRWWRASRVVDLPNPPTP